jgi:hypothetical protein
MTQQAYGMAARATSSDWHDRTARRNKLPRAKSAVVCSNFCRFLPQPPPPDKPLVWRDFSASQVYQRTFTTGANQFQRSAFFLNPVFCGASQFGHKMWLTGESVWAFYAQEIVARQLAPTRSRGEGGLGRSPTIISLYQVS